MVIELAAILFGLNSSIVTVSSEIDVGNSNSPSQSVLVSRSVVAARRGPGRASTFQF